MSDNTNPLAPSNVLSNLPKLLPVNASDLKSPQDALAALLHTALTRIGFRLIGLDDASPAQEIEGGILPTDWNRLGPDLYSFKYKHKQSTMVFHLKIVKMISRIVVHGISLEASTEKTHTLDITAADYLSLTFFPFTPTESSNNLVEGYLSNTKVEELLRKFKTSIIQKLIPKLQIQGYQDEDESSIESRPSASNPNARRQPPDGSGPPFDLPPRGVPQNNPLRVPNVGRSDLDPFGGHNPFSPPPLFGGTGGDGMFVGPDHALFRDRFEPNRNAGQRLGPWGGDGYLPPMGAPPGARFDPIFPGGQAGPLGGGFPGPGRGGPFARQPGRGGGAAGPDNDEFMPPGYGDMFS